MKKLIDEYTKIISESGSDEYTDRLEKYAKTSIDELKKRYEGRIIVRRKIVLSFPDGLANLSDIETEMVETKKTIRIDKSMLGGLNAKFINEKGNADTLFFKNANELDKYMQMFENSQIKVQMFSNSLIITTSNGTDKKSYKNFWEFVDEADYDKYSKFAFIEKASDMEALKQSVKEATDQIKKNLENGIMTALESLNKD